MLHYSSGCLRGGSCAVCKDWSEEQWKRSDAQRDKRLAKMADRGVGKKAKGSVKGTPSHKTKISPGKTVVSPGSGHKVSAGKQDRPAKRRIYQATLDKILNVGNFTNTDQKSKGNDSNVINPLIVGDKVILPVVGKFTRTTDVSFPPYISGSVAPTPTSTPDVEASRHVGHQSLVSTQTLGSVDTGCGVYPVITQNLGSVVTGREALVPTQTQASVGTIADQARSSTRECPTVVAQTSYGYPLVEATRATAQWYCQALRRQVEGVLWVV